MGSLTRPGTAAGLGAARTADVTAAAMRAALTPADPHQEEEQERSQDHQAHKDPLWKKTGRKRNLQDCTSLEKGMAATLSLQRQAGGAVSKSGFPPGLELHWAEMAHGVENQSYRNVVPSHLRRSSTEAKALSPQYGNPLSQSRPVWMLQDVLH